MAASASIYEKSVFINCPFDPTYNDLFEALVFVVLALGFTPRCARETDNAGEIRLDKIQKIIHACHYGIHDISAVELDKSSNLPRFNMPFEFGLFLGCKAFAPGKQRKKDCIVFDKEPYRYQKFISDIAGQDIHAHDGDSDKIITKVRNWLTQAAGTSGVKGGIAFAALYREFRTQHPSICALAKRNINELTFQDLREHITDWLEAYR